MFNQWRKKVCEVAGYGHFDEWQRYGEDGGRPWPAITTDPLIGLLNHSDFDGRVPAEDCYGLAARLKELLPALVRADMVKHASISSYARITSDWIIGLRRAAERGEPVVFK